jgi:uncharacterized protein (TIGR00369 family)
MTMDALTEQVRRATGLLDTMPFAAHLGVSATVDAAGLLLVLTGSPHHVGDATRGSVHGGVLAALVELAAQVQVAAAGPATSMLPDTVDFTTAFVREAAVRDTYARATVIRRGRRFVHVRAEAWQQDPADPVAAGQGTFALR